MTMLDLAAEFERRGPWITKFVVDEQSYGGAYNAYDDIRLRWFFERLPGVATILELGSFEGGHTARLAAEPGVQRVVGLEGRRVNIERAQFVHNLLGNTQVDFMMADLEDVDLAQFGTFDAVACLGVLYHLPRPWELLRQMAKVAPSAYVWTQIAGQETAVVQGYAGHWEYEHGLADPLSGLSPRSFWPTLDALLAMARDSGFPRAEVIDNSHYPPGYPIPPAPFIDVVLHTT
jgi:SAM-dependent methyltransferase